MYAQTGSRGRLITSAGVAALAALGLLFAPFGASADHKQGHNAPGQGGGGGGGGSGSGDCGGGTLYYRIGGQVWSMDCDGGNKTPLHANVSGEPSRAVHGPNGNRWFLRASNGFGLSCH